MIKKVKQRPLYLLAKEEIRRFIEENSLKNGDMLPPEGSLCERLGISRGTLREAMRVLEEEEVVIRKQGIGTFVTQSEFLISSTLDLNEGVSEMIRGKGMVPGAKNIRIEKIESNKKMAHTLNIETGDPVYLVKRLRTANDFPVAYTEDYMPAKVVSHELIERLGEGSLYDVLEGGLGIELTSSILKLSPMTATRALAKELGIKQGDLLISLKQTDTSKERMPILYSEEYFIPNRFEFVVMRKRKK